MREYYVTGGSVSEYARAIVWRVHIAADLMLVSVLEVAPALKDHRRPYYYYCLGSY